MLHPKHWDHLLMLIFTKILFLFCFCFGGVFGVLISDVIIIFYLSFHCTFGLVRKTTFIASFGCSSLLMFVELLFFLLDSFHLSLFET
jgi:hypothetical protein